MPTKFDFASPGIELREIDQSQVTLVPEEDGLLLIGRSRKGPSMKPVKVNSLENFIEVFGRPMDGVKSQDPWREGNTGAPSYAGYAAQAYLAAGVGPVKFLRLAGIKEAGASYEAGWSVPQKDIATPIATVGAVQSAVGIFVAPNTAIDGATGATVSFPVTDRAAYTPTSTITIGFVGGSHTFTTTAAATSQFNIQLSTIETPTPNTDAKAAENIKDAIAAQLSSLGITDYTVAYTSGTSFTVTQETLGTVGDGKTIVIADAGTQTGTLTFGGATNTALPIAGTLAAVLYMSASNITLTGTGRNGGSISKDGATAIVKGTNGWTAFVSGGVNATQEYTFNFDSASPNFIRNVFNTDATEFADGSGDKKLNYFLGETFEHAVNRLDASNDLIAFTAAIRSGSNGEFTDWQSEATAAKSGWFIGAKPAQKKLFRLVALEEGSDFHKNHVVRIKDIRRGTALSPNATFSLEIAGVGMKASQYIEKFVNLTLNPADANYIEKKIGNINQEWNGKKVITTGTYTNNSNLVRVEMPTATATIGADFPVGFVGPATYVGDVAIPEGSSLVSKDWIFGKNTLPNGASDLIDELIAGDTVTVSYPKYGLSEQNTNVRNGNYGSTALLGLSYAAQKGDENFGDLGQLRADSLFQPHLAEGDALTEASYTFTLDEIETTGGKYYFKAAASSPVALATLIDTDGVKQFVAPFFGGFDGLNIKLQNPFNAVELDASGYAQYSMESALNMVADRDVIRYDLISIPGVTNRSVNQDLISQTEARGDALAIIDVEGVFSPAVDNGTATDTPQTISGIVGEINAAGLDSSYAATYYPNVRLSDTLNGNGTIIVAPPSVAALGAIAKSEADSQPWFAPAGFQRGGLNPLGGSGGPAVLGTIEHLTKADRDSLYEVNINPIARFPATGDTVIFGQKTLQQSASALDRINVRRLMNYLKKEIGDIADTILFDQNVQATWNRFKAQADIVLSGVKAEFGVTEYKLVLDETTTTPDLQDRNILYAKVFVKPARAIEFIAVDFVITQSGVEF
jgi:hypothetical protein